MAKQAEGLEEVLKIVGELEEALDSAWKEAKKKNAFEEYQARISNGSKDRLVVRTGRYVHCSTRND